MCLLSTSPPLLVLHSCTCSVYVWESEVSVSASVHLGLFLRRGPINLELDKVLSWAARDPFDSAFSGLGLQVCATMLGFLMWVLGIELWSSCLPDNI